MLCVPNGGSLLFWPISNGVPTVCNVVRLSAPYRLSPGFMPDCPFLLFLVRVARRGPDTPTCNSRRSWSVVWSFSWSFGRPVKLSKTVRIDDDVRRRWRLYEADTQQATALEGRSWRHLEVPIANQHHTVPAPVSSVLRTPDTVDVV